MIQVNDYTITEKEFNYAVADFQRRANAPTLTKEQKEYVANQLIDARLLIEEATRSNVEVKQEEIDVAFGNIKGNFKSEEDFKTALSTTGDTIESLKEKLRANLALQRLIDQKFVSKIEVSDEDAEKYYKQYEDKFVQPEQVKASHILFKDDEYEKAEKVRRDILDGTSFEQMAEMHSQCPSSKSGGDLGVFGKGQMVPEFEVAAFDLNTGDLSDIIKTQFGYHIIKVTDKIAAGKKEFAEVKEELKTQIKGSAVNHNIETFVAELRKPAKITIDSEKLK